MAYVIAEPHIEIRPVDCISEQPDLSRRIYLDPADRISCRAGEEACPNRSTPGAHVLLPEWAGFGWVDATWYADAGQARSTIDRYLPAAS